MRDILIIAIVAVCAIIALRRPWVGIMLWTWLSIMNPHRYAWGLAYEAPLAAIAAISTLLGYLLTKERQSPFQGVPVVVFVLLSIWITLSWLLGVDIEGDYEQWTKVMKIYFMTFVALMLLDSKFKIIAFAWVTTF
jgi:probable O-glycosylation ligase (exosortase A-associated)